MKVWFCLFAVSWTFAQNIVFVHLGNSAPDCLFTVVKQARYFNPTIPIYLLADKQAFVNQAEFFVENHVDCVDTAEIPFTEEHLNFLKVNRIASSISNGFWVYASERFFTLFDFLMFKELKDVFHLENDCMLYAEVSELLPLFETAQLAAPFQSRSGCIPCFVFIRNRESMVPLIDHMIAEMVNYRGVRPHIYVNDMQTLASFYKKFGAKSLLPLPTLMPEYGKYHSQRKSIFPQDNSTHLSFLWEYAELFPEILFDAAGLGIFLNGNDPRISPGCGPGTVHSRCLFNPRFFTYWWGCDSQGRSIPYLSFKEKNYRIINFHFHSKKPDDYTSY